MSARSEWRAGDTKLVLFINSTPQGPSPLVNSILNYFSPLFFFFLVFNLCVCSLALPCLSLGTLSASPSLD